MMKYGAGILVICPPTQKILLLLRQSNTWANFSGMMKSFETPYKCAVRELEEESGFKENENFVIIKKPFEISKYDNFKYRCYIAISNTELVPVLNYEHSDARWFRLNELPINLHFGISDMLKKTREFG